MIAEHFIVDALRVGLILGLALVVRGLLRRRAPAARRAVLAVALAGSLVMPIVSSVTPWLRIPSPVTVSALHAHELAESLVDRGGVPTPGVREASSAGERSIRDADASSRVDVGVWRFAVWALGALVVLLRLALGFVRSRAMIRGAVRAVEWSTAIARAERATGLRADVRETDAMGSPAVTGILRPVVLVPRVSRAWSDDRRVAVLLHELAHVQSRDCAIQLVGQLACALHWFDPLAWLAVRCLRFDRELAADQAVLAAGARASSYAEDLLAIGAATSGAEVIASAALGMGGRSHLAARVTAIVSAPLHPRSFTRLHAAAVASACSAVVLAVGCTAPTATGSGAPSAGHVAKATPAEAPAPTSESAVRPAIQRVANEELDRLMSESRAAAGAILVLDPRTGEILADAGRGHGVAADVAVDTAFVTGSTLKGVTLAAALDDGVVSKDDRFDCEHGAWTYEGRAIHDSDDHGVLTVPEMLAVSSNVGFAKLFDRMGGQSVDRWLRAFHFGAPPPVDGAAGGTVPERTADRSFAGAMAVIGEAVTASPLQVAAAYGALANDGEYVPPTRTRRAGPVPHERVLKVETARAVVAMLEGVVYGEQGTGRLAAVEGARVAGKTGTAAWDLPGGGEGIYASFVGIVPSTAPRFVIVVGVEQPTGETAGGLVAAPVFARVASRALAAP